MFTFKRVAFAVGATVVIGGGITATIVQHQHHEKACAPARVAATQQGKLIGSGGDIAQPAADGSSSTLQSYLDQLSSQAEADRAATADLYTIVTTNPSCFSSDEVSTGKTWLRSQERRDSDTQSYWYCWDQGEPAPHYLGYRVTIDHLCTYGELRQAGKV